MGLLGHAAHFIRWNPELFLSCNFIIENIYLSLNTTFHNRVCHYGYYKHKTYQRGVFFSTE